MANTINILTAEIGKLLSLLKKMLEDSRRAKAMVNALGWELPPGAEDIGLTSIDLTEFLEKLRIVLESSEEEWEDETLIAARITALAIAMGNLVEEINHLAQELPAQLAEYGDYISRTSIHQELPRRILDLLIVSYLANNSFLAFTILHLLNIIEFKHFEADEENYQVEHIRAIVHYDNVSSLFSDPRRHMQESYGWGTPEFSALNLLTRLSEVFQAIGATVQMQPMDRRAEEVLLGQAVPETQTEPAPQLIINLYEELEEIAGLMLGLSVFGVRPSSEGASDSGLGFLPIVRGHADGEIPLYVFDDTVFEFSTDTDLLKRIALILRPDLPLKVQTAHSIGDLANGRFALGIRYGQADGEPKTLVSFSGGSHLSMQQFTLMGGIDKVSNSSVESFMELGLWGCQFNFSLAEADDFISNIFSEQISAPFDFRLCWSSSKGIYFHGSSGFNVTIPLHVNLGPIFLQSLYLALDTQDEGFDVEASTNGSLSLGPLTATVERLGMIVKVSFTNGNLGLFGLSPRFKPPNGFGLSIDAEGITGGGFLAKDAGKDRWIGALSLKISQRTLEGIILTEKGSFLGIVWAKGLGIPAPGGSIEGLGALIASDRRGDKEAFLKGLRNNVLDAVLFPDNLIAQAPQLIATLSRLFPIASNYTLIGIFLQWVFGSKSRLAVAEIGIIIEFKGTNLVRVYILGQGTVKIPRLPEKQLSINAQLFGSLDFEKNEYFLKLTLINSKLAGGELTGDGLFYYSPKTGFLMSLGGFNPRYKPPSGQLFRLNRLRVNLANSDNLKISFECYIALTSSSFQIGGKLSLWAGKGGFSIEGLLSLDILARFNGEFFLDITAEVAIKRGSKTLASISFSGALSGISQWKIKGKAKIKILFFKISIPVSFELGRGEPAKFEPTDAEPLLIQALTDSANWRVKEIGLGIALRETVREGVWIGGNSTIGVSQTAVPLDETLTRLGPSPLKAPQKFKINPQVKIGTQTKEGHELQEEFNFSLYQDTDLEESLRAPVLEKMQSGLEIDSEGMIVGDCIGGGKNYEEVILDGMEKPEVPPDLPKLVNELASGYSQLLSEKAFYQKEKKPMEVKEPSYIIADENLQMVEGGEGLSYAKAHAWRNQQRRAGFYRLNIVHRYEVA